MARPSVSLTQLCLANLREAVAYDLALTNIENNMSMGNTREGFSRPANFYAFCVGAPHLYICYNYYTKTADKPMQIWID